VSRKVHTPPYERLARAGRRLRTRRAGTVAVASSAFAALALLIGIGGVAVAAPQATVAQVEHEISALTTKADRLAQQLDQAKQNLASATQRLAVVRREVARDQTQFNSMRAEVGRIAAQDYEDGTLNSSIALLTSGRPQQILDQSSILLELSSANNAEMDQFLAAARALSNTQDAATRTRAGILQLKNSLVKRTSALNALIAKEKVLLAQLTPAQQKVTTPGGGGTTGGGGGGTGGGGTGGGGGHDPLPTNTQAGKAIQFAYDQLGCPYVYGGTGPCPDGFDCSGLMMEAWAAAGVSIPRTSYEDWDDLPHVSMADIQPGDILVFNDEGHVGMYVGDGELIDAPQPGMDVEKVALAGWYEENLDGAVRP
jgi:peptidoglycan DL-endopeptidase CwlO